LGQYTFLVDRRANKVEIAEAVSYIFDVDVIKVRVLNQAPKFGRWGRKRIQRKSAYKKAIVTLPPNQRIEAFEGV
jgi:large subunit ribosomal protein L23